MQKFSVLTFGLLAAFAVVTSAQNTNKNQGPTAVRLANAESIEELFRPRRVENVAAVNVKAVERSAFEMLNKKRLEKGLSPLVWSDDLVAVARQHSRNMAEFQFFSHRGLDNKLVSDRADDAGVGRWRAIGENIAFNRGFDDPVGKAVELWLDSPSHRRNLLSDTWKESAVGVAVAEDGSYYFTQVFLVRK
jgi:uncharacterized protein YkwD